VLLVAGLAVAGWTQGNDLNDPKVPFADIAAHTRTPLLLATVAHAILLLGNLVLVLNFLRTACCSKSAAPVSDLLRQPATMEVTVS
jgi:hypothetical protein